CASQHCVDGVCCDTACTGKCFFCASPETRGRCLPVKAGTIDQRAARGEKDPAKICVDSGASSCGSNGRCDGNGGCQRYANGTVCRGAQCNGGANTQTGQGTCNNGMCRVPGA